MSVSVTRACAASKVNVCVCSLPRLWVTVIIYLCSDYRFRKDEIFKRLKVTTFVQLVSWRFEVYT